MNIDMNDMYIEDMNIFDQLDSDDTIVPEEAAVIDNTDGDDLSDLGIDESDFNFDDIDEDAEEGVEEDEEVEEEESDAEEELADSEDGEAEIHDEDGEEVDFEEYEVTLPDGSLVKLNDAISGYRSAQQLADERAEFEVEKEKYQVSTADIKGKLSLAHLEAQKVVDDYADFDWVGLAKEDPAAYVENREFLDRYKARLKEINSEMTTIKELEAEEAKTATQAKAAAANDILTKSIPGWNKDMYVDLMKYGVQLGMTEDYVTSITDAGVFMALHKAKTLDNGKQIVKAKIKKTGSIKKAVSASPKQVKPVANTKKAVLKKKIESGNFDQNDMSNMFDMLED